MNPNIENGVFIISCLVAVLIILFIIIKQSLTECLGKDDWSDKMTEQQESELFEWLEKHPYNIFVWKVIMKELGEMSLDYLIECVQCNKTKEEFAEVLDLINTIKDNE